MTEQPFNNAFEKLSQAWSNFFEILCCEIGVKKMCEILGRILK